MTAFGVCVIIVLALSLACAGAINCYTCDPALPDRSCLEPNTLTNCDNVDKTIPPARYDACARLSLEMTFGQTSYNASIFWCYYKSLCSVFEAHGCRDTRADIETKGGTLDKCKLTSCCEEDGCIGFKEEEAGENQTQCGGTPDNTASFIIIIASAMTSLQSFCH